MKQLTVISGKGGTGKTTVLASFAALAHRAVLADADVDAADLHLLLTPEIKETHNFPGGFRALINSDQCTRCAVCVAVCRYGAISSELLVDPILCEGCGVCVDRCPVRAIYEDRETAGRWFESSTRFGPMIHAALYAGQDNSGKLVAQVRKRAVEVAQSEGRDLVLVAGPPGIGCPVISSLTGVDLILAVTEPSPSGLHDLDRVLDLGAHFGIPIMVCVNKADLAPELTERIVQHARTKGAEAAGLLPYDPAAVRAMMAGRPVVEAAPGPLAEALRRLWTTVSERLSNTIQREENEE